MTGFLLTLIYGEFTEIFILDMPVTPAAVTNLDSVFKAPAFNGLLCNLTAFPRFLGTAQL